MRRIASLLVVATLALAGCGSSTPETAPITPAAGVTFTPGATAPSVTDVPRSVAARGQAAVDHYETGRQVTAGAGCQACHRIGPNGNSGPGPRLDGVGTRMSRDMIERTLVNPVAPMPSFASLEADSPQKFRALTDFVVAVGRP